MFSDSGIVVGEDLTGDFVALKFTGFDDVGRQFADVDDTTGKLSLANETFTAGSVGQLGLLVDVLATGLGLVGLAMVGYGATALMDD